MVSMRDVWVRIAADTLFSSLLTSSVKNFAVYSLRWFAISSAVQCANAGKDSNYSTFRLTLSAIRSKAS